MFNNKTNTILRKKNFSNLFLSFLVILTFILILFNKTDYFIVSKIKGVGLDYVTPITRIIASPIEMLNNITLKPIYE